MNKCNLSVALDQPGKVFRKAGTVCGTVSVSVSQPSTCKRLVVATSWRSEGKGNEIKKTLASAELFEGQWLTDQEYQYRFELPVSAWPPSYSGENFRLIHSVNATADLGWAAHSNAMAELQIEPHSVESLANPPPPFWIPNWLAWILLTPIALLFLVFPPLMGGWFGAIFTIVVVGFFVLGAIQYYLPQVKLGKPELLFDQDTYQAGEPITGSVQLCPRMKVDIEQIKIVCLTQEICVKGVDDSERSFEHELETTELNLSGPRTVVARERCSLEFSLPTRSQLPASMKVEDHEIRWSIICEITLNGWSDWTETEVITVEPSDRTSWNPSFSDASGRVH